jgi:SAM-dependent methyltransferase
LTGSEPERQTPLFEQDPTGRFASRAADYAAARPSYPAGAIDLLLAGLAPPETLTAVDLGAGTGIASRLVAERGVRVEAVEPNAAMRAAAAPHPRVTWHAGRAEATGLADASADLVFCAQAFHWFEPVAALAEVRRLLRPSGRFAVLWNERDRAGDAATAEYSRLTSTASRGHPADAAYADPTPLLTAAGFSVQPRREVANAQRLDREGLLRRAASASYVPTEGPEAAALVAGLEALFARFADPRGFVTLRYATQVVRAAPQ